MNLKGQKLEVALDSLHREYKNVQESVLTNAKMQRTGKTSLQMFVYFIFDGSFICRFLYILRPPTVPRSHFKYPKTNTFILIISHLYLQIVTSASENRFCVGKCFFAKKSILYANMARKSHDFKHLKFRLFLQIFDF